MNDPDVVPDSCEKCGKPVYGWVDERCCNGRECGCMGLPLTPCWCIECWGKRETESRVRGPISIECFENDAAAERPA